jgi:hypothetical protein
MPPRALWPACCWRVATMRMPSTTTRPPPLPAPAAAAHAPDPSFPHAVLPRSAALPRPLFPPDPFAPSPCFYPATRCEAPPSTGRCAARRGLKREREGVRGAGGGGRVGRRCGGPGLGDKKGVVRKGRARARGVFLSASKALSRARLRPLRTAPAISVTTTFPRPPRARDSIAARAAILRLPPPCRDCPQKGPRLWHSCKKFNLVLLERLRSIDRRSPARSRVDRSTGAARVDRSTDQSIDRLIDRSVVDNQRGSLPSKKSICRSIDRSIDRPAPV